MSSSNFGTAINCIDGRVQTPIQQWLKNNFAIDNVDTITEPAVARFFSNPDELSKIKSKVLLSVEQSNSKIVLVSAHHDCEGGVAKDNDISQIKNAVSVIKSWNLPITVVGVWVNEHLQVESIC